MRLSQRSEDNLRGVNQKLVDVVRRAIEITEIDFMVTEGLRTEERQRELYNKKLSKTMKSKHLVGRAVDLAPLVNGRVSWDWPAFYPMAKAMKQAASELGVKIVWGGDWKTFKDGPHFELEDGE
jgi:peptidoglycan LD-endopeptidase CwlK